MIYYAEFAKFLNKNTKIRFDKIIDFISLKTGSLMFAMELLYNDCYI